MRKPVFGISDQVRHNQAVQPQKMARGLKFRKKRDCTIYMYVAKINVLINCTVTAKLIWAFVFAYTKSRFTHDSTHLFSSEADKKI